MLNQHAPRLVLYVAVAVGLLAAVLIGQFAGQGNIKNIILALGACAGVAFFLLLGKNYWMFLVFGLATGLPALPIGGRNLEIGELGAFACFIIFLLMVAFRKNHFELLNFYSLPIYAFLGWMFFIYSQNPVGLGILGAESVGFRDYLRNIFGAMAFLVIANQTLTEQDCRWVIRILIVGALISVPYSIINFYVFGGAASVEDPGSYTWHQSMSRPAFLVVLYIFCRYGAKKVFSISRPWMPALVVSSLGVAFLSGKRAVAASALLTPFIVAVLRRHWFQAFAYLFLGAFVVLVLVMGHGSVFNLPYNVQRSLANLPGDWEPGIKSLTDEGGDSFRAVMRDLAWERIKENPVVGKGMGFSMSDVANINPENYMQNIHIALALGNSWHSTWLGLWADFGLPSVIIFATICLLCLKIYWQVFRESSWSWPRPTAFHILAMMMLIELVFFLLRSYTSGSSNIGYDFFWKYGLAVAMLNSLPKRPKENSKMQMLAQSNSPAPLLQHATSKV